MEQVAGPGDAAGDSWKVTNDGWLTLGLLVLILNLLNLLAVVEEQNAVF